MVEPLLDLLRASLSEHTPVAVYFRSGRVDGVVAHLDDATVEIRHEGSRTIVRLALIDAVSAE
jgi:sRNA-binding regulator protein Hfq